MSITSSKKEILDYLWKWGENNKNWGKILVKNIVEKEEILSDKEREKIFNLFLKSIDIIDEKNIIDEDIQKPNFKFNFNSLKLISLSDVRGVNKLASGQNLTFGNNVTVVYGENGTGKSGYGRILKALGFSYDNNKKILCNVYESENEIQSAKVKYNFDGEDKEYIWESSGNCEDLKYISVFNNNCVHISLDTERELIVTPIGFHLFSLLSRELNELNGLLIQYNNDLDTELEFMDDLNENTEIYKIISKINKDTSEKDLNRLEYTEEDEDNLAGYKSDLKDLNKKLIKKELDELNNQIKELDEIKKELLNIKEINVIKEWSNSEKLLEEEQNLKRREQKSLKEIVKDRGIK